jgi:hypothetical protein
MSFTGFVNPGFGEFGVDKSGLAPITKFVNTSTTPSKQEVTKNKKNIIKRFRYPLKSIDQYDDYLKIEALDYQPPGLNLGENNTFDQRSSDDVDKEGKYKTIRGSVILPIPQGIVDSNGASWGAGEMNPLQTATMSAAMGIIGGKDPVTGTANAVTKLLGKLEAASQTALGQKTTQTFFASKATEALTGSGDFQQNLSRQSGAVFNSNIELLFSGVQLRNGFSFSYDLVPRSKKEAQEIKDIILFLKIECSAQKGAENGAAAGLFIKSPSVFRLTYMNGKNPHPFLHQFKICALTNMTVNYTASGTYATYSDATPVHMQMILSFNELTPIYREDYLKAGSKSGELNSKITGTGY